MFNSITDSDMICLKSVETYLKDLGAPNTNSPEEKLYVQNEAKNYLYSDIAQRVPRVASYILTENHLENDSIAQGLYLALSNHVMDPVFCDILQKYLSRKNSPEENAITGALLVKIMNKYIEKNWKPVDKKPIPKPTPKKGDKKGAMVSVPETTTVEPVVVEEKNDLSAIKHIQAVVNYLLGDLEDIFCTRYGNLSKPEGLAIAACVAMNNGDTIKEIIKSDLPVTASIFDVMTDPSNIIKATLLIEKNDIVGTSANQTAFIESLKTWVYNKLNIIPTQTAYTFLVSTYGSIKPDVTKYLIQIKDCGTQYSNLLTVAKQLINNY